MVERLLNAQALPVGTTLGGRYRVDAHIGAGGMGAVYKAYDTAMSRAVAIKVIHEQKRLSQEISALAALQHPHIVRIHAIEREPQLDTPVIILELINGRTLSDIVATDGPLAPAECLRIAEQALSALAEAHAKQIVHRDLKPQNMMLDAQNQLKLLDFGLAKVLGIQEQRVTQTGEIIGSVYYISPEQCLGGKITTQTDLYSLGASLYFLATGKPPFQGDNPMEVCLKQTHEDPDFRLIPDQRLALIIAKAMQKDLTKRFASAQQMSEAINGQAISTNLPTSQAPPSRLPSASPRKLACILTPLAVTAAAVLIFLNARQTQQPEKTNTNWTKLPVDKDTSRALLSRYQTEANKGQGMSWQFKYLVRVESKTDELQFTDEERERLQYTMAAIAKQSNNLYEEQKHRELEINLINRRHRPSYQEYAAMVESYETHGKKQRAIDATKTWIGLIPQAQTDRPDMLRRQLNYILFHAYAEADDKAHCAEIDQQLAATDLVLDDEMIELIERKVKRIPWDNASYIAKYYLETPHSKLAPDLRARAELICRGARIPIPVRFK